MVSIQFRLQTDGRELTISRKAIATRKVMELAERWGEAHGFSSITFWLEHQGGEKMFIQFNEEPLLLSWVDAETFRQGLEEELEIQLDLARGEYKRRLLGQSRH